MLEPCENVLTQFGKNDFVMDLLFYHRKLKRLVLIELKIGEFVPQYNWIKTSQAN